jgi:hypothetical protein
MGAFLQLNAKRHQSCVPPVGASQRPVLARNYPLDIFRNQRQQSLLVATADRSEEVLYGLDVFSILMGMSPFCTDRCARDPIRTS